MNSRTPKGGIDGIYIQNENLFQFFDNQDSQVLRRGGDLRGQVRSKRVAVDDEHKLPICSGDALEVDAELIWLHHPVPPVVAKYSSGISVPFNWSIPTMSEGRTGWAANIWRWDTVTNDLYRVYGRRKSERRGGGIRSVVIIRLTRLPISHKGQSSTGSPRKWYTTFSH